MTAAPNMFKRTGAQDFPAHLKVMVSGPPKSGKTTLLGTVPGILVLDTEPHANNLESIAHLDVPYVTITGTEDLRSVALMLSQESTRKQIAAHYGMPDIHAVAIDTLDTLQKIMKVERMREQRTTQFLRDDWAWLKTEMEAIVEMFTQLPMHVFFMVHTKTKEMGKGDDSYTITLPGLEGSISESIAGMVGYSLLSFRKEEVATDGRLYTKYWLRTEGDATHDFLGTRIGGQGLPTVIEPDMATIMKAVMNGRPKPKAPAVTPPTAAPAAPAPGPAQQEAAQTSGQPPVAPEAPQAQEAPAEQTPVETPTAPQAPAPEAAPEAPQAPAPEVPQTPATPEAERPGDDLPINAAALSHVKKVYDAIEIPFPADLLQEKANMGEARGIVKMWRAILTDHQEGKAPEGSTPPTEMIAYLESQGWVADASTPQAPKEEVAPKIDGTIEQVLAYVGQDEPDLAKVQEAYDLESAKASPRKGLINRLESLGAKPTQVQTDVQTETPSAAPETPAEGVTPEGAAADATSTEEAVKAVEQGLGGVTVAESINPDALCDVCQKPIDDMDLAEVGMKRFKKMLCVADYLAEQRK